MSESAQQKASKKYEEKRIIKPISFNSEREKELIDKIEEITKVTGLSFSVWVKQQINDFKS